MKGDGVADGYNLTTKFTDNTGCLRLQRVKMEGYMLFVALPPRHFMCIHIRIIRIIRVLNKNTLRRPHPSTIRIIRSIRVR